MIKYRLRLTLSYIATLLVAMGCASSPRGELIAPNSYTVRVTGIGETLAQAQDNGLRNAVMQVFGALTLTERSTSDDSVREENISYSRGMVEDFTVTSSWISPQDRLLNTEMLVTVSASKLGRRILHNGNAANLDGGDLARRIEAGRIQAQTERQRYAEAEKLFRHIFLEAPRALFDVKVGETSTKRSGDNIRTSVAVEVELNARVMGNICRTALSYADSMRDGLQPETSRDKGFWLIVSRCGTFLIQQNDWIKAHTEFNEQVLCISLIDREQFRMASFSHKAPLMRDGFHSLGNSPHPAAGAQAYIGHVETKHGRMTYQPIIHLTRLNWGNSQRYEVEIPQRFEAFFTKLASLDVRVTRPADCR